jgi:hypothetical protein
MNRQLVILVRRAITTAEAIETDPPRDFQVVFDVDALLALTEAINTPEKLLAACEYATEEMMEYLRRGVPTLDEADRDRHVTRARVALRLEERLKGRPPRNYREHNGNYEPID